MGGDEHGEVLLWAGVGLVLGWCLIATLHGDAAVVVVDNMEEAPRSQARKASSPSRA
jgi:hypothetical protein